ncbi:MAG: hypothetical protein Q9205_005396 [Flavoplaca limonia]
MYPAQDLSARPSLFSLPLELRFEIYRYLVPNRIHICPARKFRKVPFKPWLVNEKIKPWALASVSRQLRSEIRMIVYPQTVIEVRITDDLQDRLEFLPHQAYNVWIRGLHEDVAASIKHLVIDNTVNIDWKPDGPVPERPIERAKRERLQRLHDMEEKGEELAQWETKLLKDEEDEKDTDPLFDGSAVVVVGNWEATWLEHKPRWLVHPICEDDNRVDRVQDELRNLEMLREVFNPAVAGLGKAGIEDLVASFWGSDPRDNLCDPYEPEGNTDGAVGRPNEEEEEEEEEEKDEQYKDGEEEEETDEENQEYDYPEYGSEEDGDAGYDTESEDESGMDWDLNVEEENVEEEVDVTV